MFYGKIESSEIHYKQEMRYRKTKEEKIITRKLKVIYSNKYDLRKLRFHFIHIYIYNKHLSIEMFFYQYIFQNHLIYFIFYIIVGTKNAYVFNISSHRKKTSIIIFINVLTKTLINRK